MAPSKRAQPVEPVEESTMDESAAELQPVEPVEESTVDESAAELPFMSAGVASDLAQRGWAGDPATGGTFRKDPETGAVTYTPRGE